MLKISGTTIELTQGDSAREKIDIKTKSGDAYTPAEGDVIRFYLKKTVQASNMVLQKEISASVMTLELTSEDTKNIAPGEYVYDLELTKANKEVDTFINQAKMRIIAEVG